MSATASPRGRITDSSVPRPTYLTEVAETIRDDALVFAREKLSSCHDSDLKRLLQHPAFFDYFKYELALGVAEVLAANDHCVLEIYLHDPEADADGESGGDVPLDATVHLFVLVMFPSAALEACVAALDRALTDSLRDLPSPRFTQRASILNVILVGEEEAKYRSSYAAKLLSSVFAPPLKIWQREA